MFIMVGMVEENLRLWAEHMELDLPLDASTAIKFARENRDLSLANRTSLSGEVSKEKPITLSKWEHIHIVYTRMDGLDPKVYRQHPRDEDLAITLGMWNADNTVVPDTPLNTIDRLR